MNTTRGFTGRPRAARPGLPPGQYDAGDDWPVLSAEVTPEMTERFEFEVDTTHANENWQKEVEENLRRRQEEDEQYGGHRHGHGHADLDEAGAPTMPGGV